jgi:hypothetical protein
LQRFFLASDISQPLPHLAASDVAVGRQVQQVLLLGVEPSQLSLGLLHEQGSGGLLGTAARRGDI